MTGRSGKSSSAPRAALRIATLAAFMLLTRSSRSRHARDTYTRRLEGVSLWVVPSAEIVASDPDAGGRAVRAGGEQDLPPPDLLRHPGRGEAHLMASLPPIDVPTGATGAGAFDAPAPASTDPARSIICLRLGDDALILGQRLGEWCGHAPVLEVDISLANLALDLIGQATLLLERGGRRRPARLPPRRARFQELPAGRAAQRRLRADDRAAVALLDLAAHAAASG